MLLSLEHHVYYIWIQVKLAAEFKEKTVPQMFPVLQKHVKDGHFIGSNGVSNFAWHKYHYFLYYIPKASYSQLV